MLRALAELVYRAPRRMITAAVLFAIAAVFVGSSTPRVLRSSENDFQDPNSESVQARDLLAHASGIAPGPAITVVASPAEAAEAAAQLRREPSVALVESRAAVSRDGRLVLVTASFRADASESGKTAERLATRLPGTVGGSAVVNEQVDSQIEHDLLRAEAIAFPLLFLLALWVFRGLVAALLPLVAGALAILGALLLLRAANALHPISTFALNLVTGAGLGLSIDYTLLLVSRYREELARSGPGLEALQTTLRTAGRTVAFSALTVAVAFASLLLFPLAFLRSMAIGGLLVAPLAGLVSLTVLPALFALLGTRVNALALGRWRRAAERGSRPDERGAWYRFAHAVMRRPVPIAAAAAALLVALGLPFLGIRFTGVDASVLPESASARRADDLLRRDFSSGIASPIVLAVTREPAAVVARVRSLEGVAAVRPPKRVAPGLWDVRVVSEAPALSERTKNLVREIRQLPGVEVGGRTAWFLDTAASLRAHLPLALTLLAATTFLLLFAVTRSLVLPLKALIMNVLGLSAAFGLLVLVFQDGRLEGLLRYKSQGALELTQPVLLFAVAFGLSTDYGVFLLTRIKEAWDTGLPNREAVARGLERTGRVVTAAALLFCVAITSFATSEIVFVKELGLGIAAAVAIDASLVRALLVPSLMALLGRWNWWAPRSIGRATRALRGPRT
jgi:uncharacterized membrane protein YdfJ with MMPL/SSD domain